MFYSWKMGKYMIFCICVWGLIGSINSQKSFSSLSCQGSRTSRIVGGSEAEKNEMPYIVSLTRRGGHFCGASILNERWLLTAGHCVCNGLNNLIKPSQIRGVIGLHSISEFLNGLQGRSYRLNPSQIEFRNIVTHPGYDCNHVKNDIALLELTRPIIFSEQIRPTCLSMDLDGRNFEDDFATVSGWGWTNENQGNGDRADVLRKATVQIWNNDICERSYQVNGKRSNFIAETQMCAGFVNGGIDSCWADSGGPLVTKDNLLVGVVSTGIGCARPGLPGIYTRVSKYINWMEQVILR
ncbi:transmembrane protease serine 9 [Episyrphus balteatus]|uniref:transmembrane protease serine 9 n=1 Tax=Episyrphus balteatus TaxID=286459 RepID=UPI0024868787|nr:transmembrane protease serine 9 [Episyrphus balteatus]